LIHSRHLSLRAKTLLIQVFVVFIFVGFGFYSFWLLQNDQERLNYLDYNLLQNAARVDDFQSFVQDTITDLYQMTGTASTESDKVKLKNLQQKSLEEINRLVAEYPSIRQTMVTVGIAKDETDKFAVLMEAYTKAGKNVIAMADTDAATAMAWMTPTQARFSELDQLMDDVAKALAKEKQIRIAELTADMENARGIFAAITLAVSLLTVLLSFWLSKLMAALETLHASTNAMLESLGQGLFFFDAHGLCSPIHSKSCLDLLECDPTKKHIADVLKLTAEDRELFQTILEMMFTGKMAMGFDELAALSPATYAHSKGFYISLAYRPIFKSDGTLKNVLVVATDRTKEKKAEKRLKESEVVAQRTIRIARSRNYLMHFIHNFDACITTPKTITGAESIEQAQRDIHTLKGMATMFQFAELAHALHTLEIETSKNLQATEAMIVKHRERLMRLFEESKAYAREILGDDFQSSGQIRGVSEQKLYAFAGQLQHHLGASAAGRELYEAYCQTILAVPLWSLLEDFTVTLQESVDRMGKPLNPCSFSGENLSVLPDVYQPLFTSFVHIARNIADHGIEATVLRNQNGKNPKATVAIHTEAYKRDSRDWFFIEFTDDGGGIDLPQLRKKLAESTRASDLEKLDDHAVIQKLFDAKISTRDQATMESGRGIGLNVVKTETIKLGGIVTIFSKPGFGVRLRIDLPLAHIIPAPSGTAKSL